MQLQSRGSLEPSPTPLAANLLDRVHLFSTLLVQFVCARTGLLLTVCWSIRLFGWGGDTRVGVLNLGFIAIDPWTF
jgi:hypothetical protein